MCPGAKQQHLLYVDGHPQPMTMSKRERVHRVACMYTFVFRTGVHRPDELNPAGVAQSKLTPLLALVLGGYAQALATSSIMAVATYGKD